LLRITVYFCWSNTVNNQFWIDMEVVIKRIWLVMVDWKPKFSGNLEQGMDQWRPYVEVALKAPLAIDC